MLGMVDGAVTIDDTVNDIYIVNAIDIGGTIGSMEPIGTIGSFDTVDAIGMVGSVNSVDVFDNCNTIWATDSVSIDRTVGFHSDECTSTDTGCIIFREMEWIRTATQL